MWQCSYFLFRSSTEKGIGFGRRTCYITTTVDQASTSRGKYKIYSDEERYKIGKYTSGHGPTSAVRKFKSKLQKLNESTCGSTKKEI